MKASMMMIGLVVVLAGCGNVAVLSGFDPEYPNVTPAIRVACDYGSDRTNNGMVVEMRAERAAGVSMAAQLGSERSMCRERCSGWWPDDPDREDDCYWECYACSTAIVDAVYDE